MLDFAPWLAKRSNTDGTTKALQDFAIANADKWPVDSSSIGDYQKAVTATASGAERDDLLTALGRLYERWFQQEHAGFWKQLTANAGLAALIFAGLVIAGTLIYGIFFKPSFLELMAKPDQARGLITFLFSFATIGIIVLVAISVLWMEKSEVEGRFERAKDLITILVGVLGTIIGFYFGTASTGGSASQASVSPVTVAPNSEISVGGRLAGREGPGNH